MTDGEQLVVRTMMVRLGEVMDRAMQEMREVQRHAIADVVTERNELRALLERLEWSNSDAFDNAYGLCPDCHEPRFAKDRVCSDDVPWDAPDETHAPGCELAALRARTAPR